MEATENVQAAENAETSEEVKEQKLSLIHI